MSKILLIEDDKALVRMYKVAFKGSRHTLLSAGDGESGLSKVRREKPDLVLLDLVLPKKNGFEVLHDIKSDPKLSKIPVICLSVLHQDEEIELCRQLGALGYYVKSDIPPHQIITYVFKRLKKTQ